MASCGKERARGARRQPRQAATAVAESKPETKPTRKRREMLAGEQQAVSERITAYGAQQDL